LLVVGPREVFVFGWQDDPAHKQSCPLHMKGPYLPQHGTRLDICWPPAVLMPQQNSGAAAALEILSLSSSKKNKRSWQRWLNPQQRLLRLLLPLPCLHRPPCWLPAAAGWPLFQESARQSPDK